ncbi:MAG TPA: 16S rRNA (adenine(1518)-N(6)/adenine(1519)-N(6))-dimethyltransferase RsmA [Acidobacteriaceae bacterium]|nr:16S rRNA (adenine(1518)-N(6)/adenine(1519)-N(6))-dimethyltransferase RsmA [Acidobacteriaceae bacterium]
MRQKPKLGQNFLVDPSACAAIAGALGDVSTRTVVEIGPGAGAITGLLASRARRLVAIELDHDLAARLRVELPNVHVVEADVLTVDFSALREREEKLLIVGNLPYYITSPILLRLFDASSIISTAVVMMQREVAERILAMPGSSEYGLLSATTQLYARVERILDLQPEAFMPPPKVSSTVLRLTMQPRFVELGVKPAPFLSFLRHGFAQKRKTLAKNLRAAAFTPAHISIALDACGIPANARAEQVSLEQMAALFQACPR